MTKAPKEYFETFFPEKLAANPGLVATINAKYVFDVDGSQWTVNLTANEPGIFEGAAPDAGCTISMAGADFVAMMEKESNPMQLFMQQKLKIKGNPAMALKLTELIK